MLGLLIHSRYILWHVIIYGYLSLLPGVNYLLMFLLIYFVLWCFLFLVLNIFLAYTFIWAFFQRIVNNWRTFDMPCQLRVVTFTSSIWLLLFLILIWDWREFYNTVISWGWDSIVPSALFLLWGLLYAVVISFWGICLFLCFFLSHGVVVMRSVFKVHSSSASALFRVVVSRDNVIILFRKPRRQMHNIFWNSDSL